MNNKPLIWHTEKRKLGDLQGYEKNPRKISEQNKKELEKSLKKFNVVDIPIINIDNLIIGGNQRIKILHELYGPDFEIDVRIPSRQLTQEEIEEYNIYANTHMGEWDENILNFIPIKRLKKFKFDNNIKKIVKEKEFMEKQKENKDDTEIQYQEKNELIIENLNYKELEDLYNELKERGFKCRISTL